VHGQRQQQRHRLLALALLALQAGLVAPDQPAILAGAILVHFGLMLLWQPFWQGSTRGDWRAAMVAVAIATAIVVLTSWLLLGIWLLLLLGLIGGEQLDQRRQQGVQGLVILYLLVALLAGVTPPLFALNGQALHSVVLIAGAIPVALLVLPGRAEAAPAQRFDYLRCLAITGITLFLVAGALLWHYRSATPYAIALVQATLSVAALILIVTALWRYHAGPTLYQAFWNRFLLNVGAPFEHYLVTLAGPARSDLDPEDYLERALARMGELDWVAGVEVRAPAGQRQVGERTPYATEAHDDVAPVIVYTASDPGPTLSLHIQLLARLVQQLYLSRLHESQLRNQEKVRAVHDTGARLTHDMKNLLQSLQSLSAAVDASRERSDETLALVKRQLPYINQRLQSTLEKLREPATAAADEAVTALEWWTGLRERYADGAVEFDGDSRYALDGLILPRDLFDTVAENLLENARYKQSTDRDIAIRARLRIQEETVAFEVEDSGEAIPERAARRLFSSAVESSGGLGVGLYQCSRLAASHGFNLNLVHNENGTVRFRLSGTPEAQRVDQSA